MVPVVHRLQEKYQDQVNFVFLNADNPNTYDIQDEFRVKYRPEFYLVGPDGKVLKKFIGNTTFERFEEEFIKYIN